MKVIVDIDNPTYWFQRAKELLYEATVYNNDLAVEKAITLLGLYLAKRRQT